MLKPFRFGAGDRNRTGTVLFKPQDFKSCASASSATPAKKMEAAPRFELGNKGFAVLCLTTWLCRHFLERKTGFEPATFALARRRSTTEPLPHRFTLNHNGASGRNRTTDTRIFSPLLYRLSYRGLTWRPGRDSNPRPLA